MDIAGMSRITNYLVDSNKDSTKALEKQLNSVANADAEDAELLKACKQFEAYLWEQVLKEMDKSVKLFRGDDEEEGYAGNMVDTFKDTYIQTIATQLTEEGQGANSLSQTLYEQMKRTYSAENL